MRRQARYVTRGLLAQNQCESPNISIQFLTKLIEYQSAGKCMLNFEYNTRLFWDRCDPVKTYNDQIAFNESGSNKGLHRCQ